MNYWNVYLNDGREFLGILADSVYSAKRKVFAICRGSVKFEDMTVRMAI